MAFLRIILLQISAGALIASAAAAQSQRAAERQHAKEHEADCKDAAEFLTRGMPLQRQVWAHHVILECHDEAPRALAATLRRLSKSRDTSALAPLLRAAMFVADTSFFNAALDVANQSGASPEARATGLLVAGMEAKDRWTFDLDVVLANRDPMFVCVGGLIDHSLRNGAGVPLPANAGARLRTAVNAALAAPASPPQLLNAAKCAGSIARSLP